MATYYKSSGQFAPLSFLYFILTSLIVLPILGLIYSYAIWYIPIPYINFFITAGFGFAVGFAISQLVVRYGNVRNKALAFGFGILGCIIALYFSWAVWVDLVLNSGETIGGERIGIAVSNVKFLEVFNLALQPSKLFELIGLINEVGVWGIKGATVSGLFLGLIWVIEAGIVFFFGALMPGGASEEPFCEINQKWFDKKVLPAFSAIAYPPNYLKALESGNMEVLTKLEKIVDTKSESHSIFTLYANETNENYLSIENKIAGVNDKNEVKFEDIQVVKNISISEEFSNFLES